MTEVWKFIPGWDKYEVSDQGRIRSSVPWRGYALPRLLKPYDDGYGRYLRVRLCQDGCQSNQRIHLLVLKTFVGERPEGLEARHLDGDWFNNAASNLVWGTHSENILDQVKMGRHNSRMYNVVSV